MGVPAFQRCYGTYIVMEKELRDLADEIEAGRLGDYQQIVNRIRDIAGPSTKGKASAGRKPARKGK